MPQLAPENSSTQTKLCPVVGAHGTGKSTLLRALAQSSLGSQIAIGQEIPRLICDAAERPDYYQRANNTFAKQIHLLFEQLATEVDYQLTKQRIVVLDRSLIDHFAYTKVLFERELQETCLGAIIKNRLSKLCPRYATIFYIPIEVPLIADGTREGDDEFQRAVDREISSLLSELFPNYIDVAGTVEARLAIISKHLAVHA
jgi:nicotinamide riboside kinase